MHVPGNYKLGTLDNSSDVKQYYINNSLPELKPCNNWNCHIVAKQFGTRALILFSQKSEILLIP